MGRSLVLEHDKIYQMSDSVYSNMTAFKCHLYFGRHHIYMNDGFHVC
jgi:hypothetical protein